MVTYSVRMSRSATTDLRGIVRYISLQLSSPATALTMLNSIEAAIAALSSMPKKHRLVNDDRLSQMGYRTVIVKNYCVFYLVDDTTRVVHVARIMYARRDWRSIL